MGFKVARFIRDFQNSHSWCAGNFGARLGVSDQEGYNGVLYDKRSRGAMTIKEDYTF